MFSPPASNGFAAQSSPKLLEQHVEIATTRERLADCACVLPRNPQASGAYRGGPGVQPE